MEHLGEHMSVLGTASECWETDQLSVIAVGSCDARLELIPHLPPFPFPLVALPLALSSIALRLEPNREPLVVPPTEHQQPTSPDKTHTPIRPHSSKPARRPDRSPNGRPDQHPCCRDCKTLAHPRPNLASLALTQVHQNRGRQTDEAARKEAVQGD